MWQQSKTFIAAKQQFQDWRISKHTGDPIPENLWNIVAKILENPLYKKTVITRGLGISTEQLRRKFPECFAKSKKSIKPSASHQTFVQASLVPLTAVMPATFGLATIEHKNGAKFILREPTAEQLSIIVKLFME